MQNLRAKYLVADPLPAWLMHRTSTTIPRPSQAAHCQVTTARHGQGASQRAMASHVCGEQGGPSLSQSRDGMLWAQAPREVSDGGVTSLLMEGSWCYLPCGLLPEWHADLPRHKDEAGKNRWWAVTRTGSASPCNIMRRDVASLCRTRAPGLPCSESRNTDRRKKGKCRRKRVMREASVVCLDAV